MEWVVGIIGFLVGFGGGIALLNRWLKDRSREELIRDKALHKTYGLIVWMIAGVTAAGAIYLYRYYF